MGANGRLSAKVICFTCRESTCLCVSAWNQPPDPSAPPPRSEMARVFAWLGGACVAGTALGAGIALLLGG